MTPSLRPLRISVLVCALLAFVAYALAEQSLLTLLVLAGFGCGGWWMTDGRFLSSSEDRPGAEGWVGIPRWATSIILTIIGLGSLWRGFAGANVVSAFLAFLAAVLVLKLWERRAPRDYAQLLTMSLFLAVGSTLNDNGLGVGVSILLLTPTLVCGAMHHQIYTAWHRARSGGAGRGAPAALNRKVGWATAASVVVGLVIASVVFVVTPRGLGMSRFGAFARPMMQRVTGFAEQVDLNNAGLISQSHGVVMSVRRVEPSETSAVEGEPLYLRGSVLDDYRDGRWRSTRVSTSQNTTYLGVSNVRPEGETAKRTVKYVTTMHNARGTEIPLFHVWRPIAISFQEETRWQAEYLTCVIRVQPPAPEFNVTVVSSLDPDPLSADLSTPRGRVEFNPGVRAVAEKVLLRSGLEPDPAKRPPEEDSQVANAFQAYLRGNYTYTLNPPVPPISEDPTAWFLEKGKRGHCEFFASALAGLCRSVGIDARVVAGYMTNEFDASSGTYTVRNSDAHAWVEVNTAPGVWRTFDGTPVASPVFARQQDVTLASLIAGALDNVEMFWNSNVVGFDESRQKRVLGLSENSVQPLERLSRLIHTRSGRRETLQAIQRAKPWLAGAGACLVVTGGVMLAVGIARKRLRRTGVAGAVDGWAFSGAAEADRLHRGVLGVVERSGRRRPAGVPLAMYLRGEVGRPDAPAAWRDAAERLARVVDVAYAGRFGAVADRSLFREAHTTLNEAARLARSVRKPAG